MLFRSDRKSTRLNSSHLVISYAVFCLKKKKKTQSITTKQPLDTAQSNRRNMELYHHLGAASMPILWSIRTLPLVCYFFFFFFNHTATTEIYTLSLHDALPIYRRLVSHRRSGTVGRRRLLVPHRSHERNRSEEHTSELQSPCNLVCRLLLE